MASNYFFEECQLVALRFPQCQLHGWGWCPKSSLCHVESRMVCFIKSVAYFHLQVLNSLLNFRGPGVAILVLSWVITLFTLWQMVEMHEMVPGKRFDRYHELGQHAFGEKLGLWIVVPQQLVCEVGVDIVYMVTGGKALQKVHSIVRKGQKPIKLTYFIMIYASAQFVLAHLPNFGSISGVSLTAAVMCLRYNVH